MNYVWLIVVKGVLDILDRLIDHDSASIPGDVQEKYAAFAKSVRDTEVA